MTELVCRQARAAAVARPPTPDLGAELARLREELEIAGQRFEVALAALDAIADHVEDHADQVLVIDHVVRRWRSLGAASQATHTVPGSPLGPLAWFAVRFTDEVDREPFTDLHEHEYPPPDEAEAIVHRHWCALVDRLRGKTQQLRSQTA